MTMAASKVTDLTGGLSLAVVHGPDSVIADKAPAFP
jgi:hypothetical protein